MKGVGKTQPDPSMSKFIENVEVPLGKGVPTGCENSSLLYNEYPFYVCIIYFSSLLFITV